MGLSRLPSLLKLSLKNLELMKWWSESRMNERKKQLKVMAFQWAARFSLECFCFSGVKSWNRDNIKVN